MSNFNKIYREERKATREELNKLYKTFVCSKTDDKIVEMISDSEMRRLLTLNIYDYYIRKMNNKGLLIQKIILVVNVSKSYIYELRPARKDV